MKSILFIFSLLALTSIWYAQPVSAASDEKAKKCIAMIKDMTGADPSPKVIKLCKEGKSEQAMEEAMSGG